jgi:hypothetical protein
MRAKLVNETLQHFEKKSNPLDSLGIGKKVAIENWLKNMKINLYIINDDLSIDVNERVDLWNKNLDKLPDYIEFNRIFGNFNISDNDLISMKGFPKIIYDDFYCCNNILTSLKGCPKKVHGNFYFKGNKGTKFTEEDIREVCNVSFVILL